MKQVVRTARRQYPLPILLVGVLEACGGSARLEENRATAGASAYGAAAGGTSDGAAGGTFIGANGGAAASAGSTSSAGGKPSTASAGSTNTASAGSTDHAGGSPSAASAGSTSNAAGSPSTARAGSTSNAAGSGPCIDVCQLQGPACCMPAHDCVSPASSCVFDIYTAAVDVTYDYATLEQKVAALPRDLLATVRIADAIVAAAETAPASRIELRLSDEITARYGAMLDQKFGNVFRVSCDGQSLFVGVLYMAEGAAALATPVLHFTHATDGALVLHLGAWQGAWAGFQSGPVEARERIDRPELRGALCARGPLLTLTAR